MPIYDKNDKLCGTCLYWGGQRVLDHAKREVEVPVSANGLCAHHKKPFGSRKPWGYETCDYWVSILIEGR